jgi:DNA-binding transcriptional LysR family regulator
MPRPNITNLLAFRAVARERSFTRAAAQIGVSPSALSHTIRALEERLGVRLLTRTTRSVLPTEAGERLLGAIGPHFDGIEAELEALSELRDKPAGSIRITTGIHAAETILWPALATLLPNYPDIQVELSVQSGFIDIVAERFDAGVRLGETIARDMVAVRIGPDMRMAAVASPAYFSARKPPRTPHDLALHNCINLRFPTRGGLYAWEFEMAGRALNVRVEGQLIVNDIALALGAAIDGLGVAYLPEDYVRKDMDSGRLTRALESWCPPFSGYHLYYPSRRHQSAAFALLIEALRYRP